MAEASPEEDVVQFEEPRLLNHLKTFCDSSKSSVKEDGLSNQECFLLLLLLVKLSLLCIEHQNDTELQNSSACLLCPTQSPNTDETPSGHVKLCSYDMLLNHKQLAPENAEEVERFSHEMRDLWISSKSQVAMEFGFSADEVAFALARYAAEGKTPKDAAELIDRLDEQDCERWKSFIFDGFAARVLDSNAKIHDNSYPEEENDQFVERAADVGKTKENEKSTEDRRKLIEETNHLLWLKCCSVCRKKDANMLTADCGHVSMCSKCSEQCNTCPRCGGPSTLKIKVYTA